MRTGAISHPDLQNGAQPVSASDVNPGQVSLAPTRRKPTVLPRPLAKHEIKTTTADFARAAGYAMEAGFDGVQILANYLYLILQFLNASHSSPAMDLLTQEIDGVACWPALR
jgi:N-ethylmaleimide reductase